MGPLNEWPRVGLLVSTIDVSSAKNLSPTFGEERNDTSTTLLTMPTKPEGLPPQKSAVSRNDVNLRFPRFYIL